MCITVRVDAAMLTELLAEVGNESLSKLLNNKVKRALQTIIKEAHIEKGDKNAI
jgi:hypothetical protein